MTDKKNAKIRETDDTARALAASLIDAARFGAIALYDKIRARPHVARIGFSYFSGLGYVTLISDLATHTKILQNNPDCALLLGEPPNKGDPLAFARISMNCQVIKLNKDDPAVADLRENWLREHPKSAIYIGFSDFNFYKFQPNDADLYGGFGKAFTLNADDLPPA